MLRLMLAVLLAVVLVGCKQQVLYSDLTESEANEILSLLLKYQLRAAKATSKSGTYAVETHKEDFSAAYNLLAANGLPRQKFTSVQDVFNQNQLVESALALRARYNSAVSQEIAHTLSIIDGVLRVRVHLVVPESDPLSDSVPLSSASVLIKHREDVDLSAHLGQIKALVVNGTENLPYENVSVALFPQLPMTMPVQPANVKEPDLLPFKRAGMSLPPASALVFLQRVGPLGYVLTGFALLGIVLLVVLRAWRFRVPARVTTHLQE